MEKRRTFLACKWLIMSARQKRGMGVAKKLAIDFIDSYNHQVCSVQSNAERVGVEGRVFYIFRVMRSRRSKIFTDWRMQTEPMLTFDGNCNTHRCVTGMTITHVTGMTITQLQLISHRICLFWNKVIPVCL